MVDCSDELQLNSNIRPGHSTTLEAAEGNTLHEQPVFEHLGYNYGDFPESEKASKEVMSLPMHPFLKDEEQTEITNKLMKWL